MQEEVVENKLVIDTVEETFYVCIINSFLLWEVDSYSSGHLYRGRSTYIVSV